MDELSKSQVRKLEQIVRLRAEIDVSRKRADISIYQAVRVANVPVRVVAERLNLTRQRVYQMVRNGSDLLDSLDG
jgi:hypothetical protein